jgi:hypothetical protein
MPAYKLRQGHFRGAANLYAPANAGGGLDDVIRGIAIDLAQTRLQVAAVHDFTDNSTGTPAAAFVDVPALPAVFDATSAGGVQLTALNTSLGKVRDAQKVIGNNLNIARALLGLDTITMVEGTQATVDVIPAQDKTATTAAGAAAVSNASFRASFAVAKSNQRKLERAVNEILVALGSAAVKTAWTGAQAAGFSLPAIPVAVASATGSDSVALANGTAALTALANNYATLASKLNAAINQATPSALRVVAS